MPAFRALTDNQELAHRLQLPEDEVEDIVKAFPGDTVTFIDYLMERVSHWDGVRAEKFALAYNADAAVCSCRGSLND